MATDSGVSLKVRAAKRLGGVILAGAIWLMALGQVTSPSLAQAGGAIGPVAAGGPVPEVGYAVDTSWPRHSPAGRNWGEMAGLCLDDHGQIWAFHRGKVPVEIYSPSGELVRAWGEGQFGRPHQVRQDRQGRIWMADAGLHVVRQYDAEGHLLRTLGTPGEAGENETRFDQPTDVAIASDGAIFVADGYGNDRVVKFDAQGRFVKAWGRKGDGPGEFDLPHAIAIDSKDRLYVADRGNGRVQVFDVEGRFLSEWAGAMMPWHIVITPRDEVYVCGSSFMQKPKLRIPGIPRGIPPRDQVVAKYDTAGRELASWRFPIGRKPGELEWVHGMAVGGDGSLWLGDIRGRRAQKFVPRGELIAGQPKADAAVKQAAGEKPK